MQDLMRKGKSRPEICKTYEISPSTLQNFIGEEAKLCRKFEMNGNAKRCMIRNYTSTWDSISMDQYCARAKGDSHWANGSGESHRDCAALQ